MTSKFARALLIGVFAAAAGSCSDSSGPSGPADILILGDGTTEVDVEEMLDLAGHNATLSGFYADHTDTDFSDYDLVILLNGNNWGPMQPGVEQALLDYVSAGGTLLATEWVAYGGFLDLIIEAFPLAYQGYCDLGNAECDETYTRDVNHPITNGVAATFDTPSDWTMSLMALNATTTSTNVTVLYTGSLSGPALAVATRGSGRLVQWNMGGEYGGDDIWDDNTSRILTNIAKYSVR